VKAVTIERLAFGGSGFGRLDGKACFVPFTAPGDVVEITPTVEKKSYITAKLERIISPSPARILPPCPVFGRCGGCQWQHLPYEAQLEAKREIFTDTLRRTGGVPWEAVLPPLAAPDPFGYRSRIQLKVHGRSEKLQIGFFAQGSHYVVDIGDACPLASPAVNAVLPATRRFLSISPDKGYVPQVDIATGEGGGTVMIFHYIGKNVKAFADALSRFDFPADYHLAVQSGRKSALVPVRGDGRLSYGTGTDHPLSLTFGPGAFSQVNYR
jgi:23S rRNA (uracil1939-C5)-methyltransferase